MVSRVAAVVALTCVALLAGCTPTAAPDPMNDQLRSAIRQDRADTAWQIVADEYPEALRPDIDVGAVLDDAAWAVATEKCFADQGFIVVRDGSTFQYSSSQGQSPLQFAVAQYHCSIAEPSVAEVSNYLDVFQRQALYDYYLGRVQPCLALNGVATQKPPSRTVFESSSGTDAWSPFAVLGRGSSSDARRIAELQQVCPPVPDWLHL